MAATTGYGSELSDGFVSNATTYDAPETETPPRTVLSLNFTSSCVLPPGSCGSGAGTEIASDLAVHLNLQEPVGIVLKLPLTCELRCRVCVSKLRESQGISQGTFG